MEIQAWRRYSRTTTGSASAIATLAARSDLRILVVDDNASSLEIFQELLQQHAVGVYDREVGFNKRGQFREFFINVPVHLPP